MRLLVIIFAAGVVGSTLVAGVKTVIQGRPDHLFQEVGRLYVQDPILTISLAEKAALACVPRLNEIRSKDARNLVARSFILGIQTSSSFGDNTSREEMKRQISAVATSVMRKASQLDVLILDDILDQKHATVAKTIECIARSVKASHDIAS